jgi:hypothetical protein
MRTGVHWRRPPRLPKSLLTECCAGKSASQMCLPFAALGESNGACSFAPKRSAAVLMRTQKPLAAFYP